MWQMNECNWYAEAQHFRVEEYVEDDITKLA